MNGKKIDQNESNSPEELPNQDSCSSPFRGIRGFAGYLISCCPYTMIGKKILWILRGETGTPREQLTNREIYLKNNIKIGYGIMLIGVFCPIFWISFLLGARGSELMFNAVHSGIVIMIGILYFATYRIQLGREFGGGNR
ncbi:MAG: hypothetical protein PHF64_08085 [Methanoregula sp.]|nr:hypothetical protein [Methanoregula sp.]